MPPRARSVLEITGIVVPVHLRTVTVREKPYGTLLMLPLRVVHAVPTLRPGDLVVATSTDDGSLRAFLSPTLNHRAELHNYLLQHNSHDRRAWSCRVGTHYKSLRLYLPTSLALYLRTPEQQEPYPARLFNGCTDAPCTVLELANVLQPLRPQTPSLRGGPDARETLHGRKPSRSG